MRGPGSCVTEAVIDRSREARQIVKIETKRMAVWMQPEQIHLDISLRDVRHALEYIADVTGMSHGLEAGPIFRALRAGGIGHDASLARRFNGQGTNRYPTPASVSK